MATYCADNYELKINKRAVILQKFCNSIHKVHVLSDLPEPIFHARMRDVSSYLHLFKTTRAYYMYQATIVNKTLMQIL